MIFLLSIIFLSLSMLNLGRQSIDMFLLSSIRTKQRSVIIGFNNLQIGKSNPEQKPHQLRSHRTHFLWNFRATKVSLLASHCSSTQVFLFETISPWHNLMRCPARQLGCHQNTIAKHSPSKRHVVVQGRQG